jgi:8-oxo-dGTP diphosphatase
MNHNMNQITREIAVGIVMNHQQEILISKRSIHKPMGGFWEFPGGKIEEGETPEIALKRELQEEVGLEVLDLTSLMQHQHSYNEYSVQLNVFLIQNFKGQAKPLEGQEIQWTKKADLLNYNFLEANEAIIQILLTLDA